ncbi:hypothetical protein CsSME_00042637 [Camellia sinensis var. sinensis]
MRMRIIKSLFVWLTYASIIRFNWGCLEEQRAALLKIKDSINSPVGSAFSSWYDKDCCQWEAVECDPSNSTVIKLFFYYRRDKSIPENWYPNATSFAQLKDLQELHLEGNQIGGFTSPSGIPLLSSFQYRSSSSLSPSHKAPTRSTNFFLKHQTLRLL